MACTRQAHGIIASLSTVLISILLLALERSVLSHYQHRLAKHSTAWPPHQQHPSEVKPLALVPEDLDTTPTKLVVACGALGLIAGIVGFFRTTSPAKSGERLDSFNEKPRRPYFTLTWTLLTTLLGLASFIYASIAQSKSSTFRYTDFTSGDQTFTRESWACQLATYYPDDEWSALTETCKEAWTARWLLVPLIAALSYQLCIAIIDMVSSRRQQPLHRRAMEMSPFSSSDDHKAASESEDEDDGA